MIKQFSVIVAGGSGTRMKATVPKQFLLLKGKPILMRTIEKFYLYDKQIPLILVLPEKQMETWKSLCEQFNFEIPHQLVKGGETRFESVKNALKHIEDEGVVSIHDGVRPLVDISVIEQAFRLAGEKGNAITVIQSNDSIRLVTEDENRAVERNNYVLVQTPQVFDIQLIKKAYQQAFDPAFTDDASVVEKLGVDINYVEGHRENLKITTPLDMKLAEILLD